MDTKTLKKNLAFCEDNITRYEWLINFEVKNLKLSKKKKQFYPNDIKLFKEHLIISEKNKAKILNDLHEIEFENERHDREEILNNNTDIEFQAELENEKLERENILNNINW